MRARGGTGTVVTVDIAGLPGGVEVPSQSCVRGPLAATGPPRRALLNNPATPAHEPSDAGPGPPPLAARRRNRIRARGALTPAARIWNLSSPLHGPPRR